MTRALATWTATLTAAALLTAGCEDDKRVSATPQSLAAIAVEHADISPTLAEGSTEDGGIGAYIEFDDGNQILRIGTTQEPAPPGSEECDDRGTCDVISTSAGDVDLYWEDEEPEEDPGLVMVVFETEDGTNGAYYSGDSITGDPRDLDLGVDVDDMVAIVTDDRFGTTTTQAMTEFEVPGWVEHPTELTPQLIAYNLNVVHQTVPKLAAYEADASAYGDGSIGAVLELDDGITFTGYYVPDPSPSELCPSGWTCNSGADGILTGQPQGQVNDFASSSPLELMVADVSNEDYATIVVRVGPALAGFDPREDMASIAGRIIDVDSVDSDDIVEIDAIWEDR